MRRAACLLCVGVLVAAGAARDVWAQRTLTEADRELLEMRIEALERRFDDERVNARPLTDAQLRPTTEQVRRLDEKIDERTRHFNALLALAVVVATLLGFLANYLGRRALKAWALKAVEDRVEAGIRNRLEAPDITALVQERAIPVIQTLVEESRKQGEEKLTATMRDLEQQFQVQADALVGERIGEAAETIKRSLEELNRTLVEPAIRDIRAEAKAQMEAAQKAHERLLEEQRAALQAAPNPSEEQSITVSELIESQRQNNPDPEDWGALDWILHARRLSDEGRLDEALAALDRALDLEPSNVIAVNNRGWLLNGLGRHDEALADFDRSLALSPDDPVMHGNRGVALNGLGRHDEALAALDRAIEIRPYHPADYSDRARALIGKKNAKGALREADRSLALAENDSERDFRRAVALYYRAAAIRLLGRPTDDAEAALDAALAVPFERTLAPAIITPPDSDDAVEAFVARLSDKLREHDAARGL